jgi:hypothetical protein
MYQLFTDRARKVLQLANQEAQRFNHEYIGTEHILLGLVSEGSGVATEVLVNLGLDLRRIRWEIERLVQPGLEMASLDKSPHIPRAKKVIEYSMEESRDLKHDLFGTEHILLGLLREEKGVAARALANLGLKFEEVRAEVLRVLAQPHDWGRPVYPPLPPMQTVAERLQPPVEPPAVCPKCGQARVVRVIWQWRDLSGRNLEDVTTGKAILGSRLRGQGPPWVCLQCEPRWSEVRHLAQQAYQCQLAKEEAVGSQDFDAAAKFRDEQDDLLRRLEPLVNKLLQSQ